MKAKAIAGQYEISITLRRFKLSTLARVLLLDSMDSGEAR